jgi:hypothetical protein
MLGIWANVFLDKMIMDMLDVTIAYFLMLVMKMIISNCPQYSHWTQLLYA